MSFKTEQMSDSELSAVKSSDPLLADTFPSKAFLVIEFCEQNDPNVAGWSDDGSTMIVKNPQTFALSHLPRYFKHSNFASFVRQLNIYGWQKVKDYNSSEGSVAFLHASFQRGRPDLLGNIKRSYKKPSKKPRIQEEKKEEYSSFNTRFDEMQQQMDTLADKLDLLISIVTSDKQNGAFVERGVHAGGKRQRQDFGGRGSPLSDDATDPTAVSKDSASSISSADSSPTAAVKVVPRFTLDMDVVDEEAEEFESAVGSDPRELYHDLIELRESTRELDEIHPLHHSAAPEGVASMNQQQESNDDDDFKQFIDKMLDGNGQDSEMQCEQYEQEAVDDDTDHSTTFVSDPLMSKHSPDAVRSHVQMPQSTATAVVVCHNEDEEYDEEAGDFASSTPLTTAVAVEDAPVARKRFSRRFKIFVATAILIVLAGLIIWPLAVFLNKKNKPPRRPPPRPEGVADGGRHGGDGHGRDRSKRSGSGSGRWRRGSGSSSGSGSGKWRDRGDTPEGDGVGRVVDYDGGDNVFGESSDTDGNESHYFDRTEDTGRIGLNTKSIHGDSLTLAWHGGSYECVVVQPPPPPLL